jgi:hypothetical protein
MARLKFYNLDEGTGALVKSEDEVYTFLLMDGTQLELLKDQFDKLGRATANEKNSFKTSFKTITGIDFKDAQITEILKQLEEKQMAEVKKEIDTVETTEEVKVEETVATESKEEAVVESDVSKALENAANDKKKEKKTKVVSKRICLFQKDAEVKAYFFGEDFKVKELVAANIESIAAIDTKMLVFIEGVPEIDFGLAEIPEEHLARAATNSKLSYTENRTKLLKTFGPKLVAGEITIEDPMYAKVFRYSCMHLYKSRKVAAKYQEYKAALKKAKADEKATAKAEEIEASKAETTQA